MKLVALAGGKNPLDRNPGACLQLAGIAKMCLRRNLTQFESDILMYPRLVNTKVSKKAKDWGVGVRTLIKKNWGTLYSYFSLFLLGLGVGFIEYPNFGKGRGST